MEKICHGARRGMVYLQLTASSIETLTALKVLSSQDESINATSEKEDHKPLPRGVIAHSKLIDLAETNKDLSLDTLLRGSKVWFPPKKQFARSKELEDRLAEIRKQQEYQSYQSMTGHNDSHHHNNTNVALDQQEWIEIKRQISALVNIFFSAIGVGTATWWSLGEYTRKEVKLSATLVTTTAIVVIEAFLYARHFQRMTEKRKWKEQARKGKLTFQAEEDAPVTQN
ncbi:unnamed protein product [Sympodiomycopsis kandeliae]